MVVIAPRIDPRLVAALGRIDDSSLPIAETNRRLGQIAAELGFPKPSYEQVRVFVHALRRRKLDAASRRTLDPSLGELLLDFMLRTRSPEQILELLTGYK